jgi:hypothetical protein
MNMEIPPFCGRKAAGRPTTKFALLLLAAGCATMDVQDHGFQINGVGAVVQDVSYEYGPLKGTLNAIGIAGGSTHIRRMPVPETLTIKWTTADGQRHDVTVPVKSRVPRNMQNKRVSVDLDGPKLLVFLEEPSSGSTPVRTQIYP